MSVATTQINLTIKHIFSPLSTPHNLSVGRTHSPIYHPQKTINYLARAIPNET